MYLSSSDEVNNIDVNDTSQTRQGNELSVTSNPSQSSSPLCTTLLVIEDNSNSNDKSFNTTDIPSTLLPSSAQENHVQTTPSSPSSTIESSKDVPEQQRRRNSSIAKLLGGQPLNNQQYEEINQKILDDQSNQNLTNNSDSNTESGIQHLRSSITRTLLMNSESNDNTSTTTAKLRPPSPGFSKDFEYLIRRELDIEHAPSTLNRNNATPSIFQNLSSARNMSTNNSLSSQSKLKRKRLNPNQILPSPTLNKSSTNSPFSIHDPFELDSSSSSINHSLNTTPTHRSHQQQNDLYRFDTSLNHLRHQNLHQNQQPYSLTMNGSTPNLASFTSHKLNMNSSVCSQFKINHNRLSTTTCSSASSSSSSSSCNSCPYPMTVELTLPIPVSPLSPNPSSPTFTPHHTMSTPLNKNKTIHNRPNIYEIPTQRSYSTISTQSGTSLSSGHSVPLKKRLLHAYKNEQGPSSSL